MAYAAGDILLVRNPNAGSSLISNLIMAGERARYGNSEYSVWTHSALIVSDDGWLVEALEDGVTLSRISKYDGYETLVVSPDTTVYATPDKREYACAFARAQIGDKYDILDFISIALTLLTGLDWSLHSDKRFICSQLVARATECYTAYGYQYPCEQMLPADVAAEFYAIESTPLPPLSFIGRCLDKFRAVVRSIL